jgi:hypothetical protein
MQVLTYNKQLKTIILFKSKFGRHVVIQEFGIQEILKKIIEELSHYDLQIMELKNESLLDNLTEVEDEDKFIHTIRTRKFNRKLIKSNLELRGFIEDYFFSEPCGSLTVVLTINLEDPSIEFVRVVNGNHIGLILENLDSWMDSTLWEEGVMLLSDLMDYLDTLNLTRSISDDLGFDEPEQIDPRLN